MGLFARILLREKRDGKTRDREERDEKEMREIRETVRVSECGRKIRNVNRMPKSDDRTESNLRRGRREEGGREDRRKTRRKRGGEVGRGEEGGGVRPEKSGVRICTRSKETLLSQE